MLCLAEDLPLKASGFFYTDMIRIIRMGLSILYLKGEQVGISKL